ncbi:serine/threonine protein kinase [Tengunoibacter tsumagoiensis]|uniref:Protein kinase domain-containing protein n=1 Tax=Tengunoibacter tsumagoiensis TaxID=2014871 RepID=A0A402A0Q8_9CHLR|nr:serine/threonine-protein kinase [Tengunoibacter tsumagoiensis]GCE12738.1 hypothetical protein KTT_25970 [Tengunoibacter tsumagoiensis]
MIETVPSGTVLHGRYRIERVLGSGGFGHVYLAIDLTSNQQCAVKEYLVSGASGQEQLKHEATVLSQLHHPSLPAFEAAFIERGRYYVVLNYIEGNDLTDLVRITTRQRNEVIPTAQILHWMLAICDAVTFLHQQQPTVIHRDIKPDNIRITPSGTAVLVDLGNAKAAADGARTLFFIRHQGTPGYAPPEQYPGGSGTDARSDIYALGGTLYFALTSQEPPSVSTRNQSIQQGVPDLPTLQDHLNNNPPEESPEANAARQFRLGVTKPQKPAPRHSNHIAQLGTLPPEILQQMTAVIHKAMAIKPKYRYQQVAELAQDLRRITAKLPPASPPPSKPRKVDPHSTQPDLAELYEAIQDAKQNAQQPDSGTQPMGPNNGAHGPVCPRCGSAVQPRAGFCPRCGASLSSPHHIQISKPATRNSYEEHDSTLVITPGNQRDLGIQPQRENTPRPPRSASPVPAKGEHQVASPPRTQGGDPSARNARSYAQPVAQAVIGTNQVQQHTALAAQALPASVTQNQSTSENGFENGFKLGNKALLILILTLAALLLLTAILVISLHGH